MGTKVNGGVKPGYRIHWHVVLTHFPISFFMVSAGFMVLHLFTETACFEVSAFLTLIAGTIILIPTTLSGWLTWKSQYKQARIKLFLYKIYISFALIAISITILIFRGFVVNTDHGIWHFIYSIGFVILFFGSMAEGYYGGRLSHR